MIVKPVADVLRGKNIQELLTLPGEAKVSDAVAMMTQRGVGAVVVRGSGGGIAGIFTERDLMRRVVAVGVDPRTTALAAVMSPDVRRVPSSATIEDALRLMIEHGHRHVLVEDEGTAKGLLSIRDLMSILVLPDEPIAHEGRGGVIRARAEDALRAVQRGG